MAVKPTPPARSYSFTDHSVVQPTVPQPGDKIDAEIDEGNQFDSDLIDWVEQVITDSGGLQPGIVKLASLDPEVSAGIGADAVADAEAAAVAAAASAAAASASQTAAGGSATTAATNAGTAGGHATDANNSKIAAAASAVAAAASAANSAASAVTAGNFENDASAAAAAASLSETRAENWAEKLDGPVDDGKFSAHWWAVWIENHIDTAVGPQGPAGADGTDGKTWHNGSGAPNDLTGVNGDFYLDTLNDAYYGPKTAGSWTGTGPQSLVGPQGPQGDEGPMGPEGPEGPEGPQGPAGSGTGDVIGPAGATDNNFAAFDLATGKLIKDSGSSASSFAAAAHVGAGGAAHANAVAAGAAGFMTGTDKSKLDGIAANANNYSHPNHTGDVTSVGDGAQTIANNAVTNAKAADMAADTIKGRANGAGTGDPTDLTATQVRTILNVDVKTGTIEIKIAGNALYARTTNGGAPVATEGGTNRVMTVGFAMDSATREYIQAAFPMIPNWNEGTVRAKIGWTTAAASGNAVFGVQAVAVSDDDPRADPAFGTAQEVTDGVTAANDRMETAYTAAITIAGTPATGDEVIFQIYRKADDANDTINSNDVVILDVTIEILLSQLWSA